MTWIAVDFLVGLAGCLGIFVCFLGMILSGVPTADEYNE